MTSLDSTEDLRREPGRPVGEAFVAVAARSDVVDILDAAAGHDKPATTRS